jgi:hypothetical protein
MFNADLAETSEERMERLQAQNSAVEAKRAALQNAKAQRQAQALAD